MLDEDGYLFHSKKGKPVESPIPLAPLADTHGHLTAFRRLDAAEVVARAALVGVRLLVVPVDPSDDVEDAAAFLGWFNKTVERAANLLEKAARDGFVPPSFPNVIAGAVSGDRMPPVVQGIADVPPLVENVHFIAGVHPYGSERYLGDPGVRERLCTLLADERCVGIGEFGLDYGPWNETDPKAQAEAFRQHLRLAHEAGLPVELHLRDANDDQEAQAHMDALRILMEEGVPRAGCDLHCFTSGPEVMAPFVELGCHIAFGGASTFSKSDDIRAAAAACPEDLLLLETDSPYMAPAPLRGMECESAMIAFTAARVATVRAEAGIADPERTYAAQWHNANAFFGLSA